MSEAGDLAAVIAAEFKTHVHDEYVPRIGRCVELLSHDQLWERPSEFGNSVGNLLLHLEGNTRQWIFAGIGGHDDHRDRDSEFTAEGTAKGSAMMAALRETVEAAVARIESLSPAQLLEVRRFQSRWDQSCLAAVLHVMEHFSGHAGQIYAHTKRVLDVDLRFWDL